MLHQLPRADLGAVDVTLGVHRHTLRQRWCLSSPGDRNAVHHVTVLDAADTDAALPTGMQCHAVGEGQTSTLLLSRQIVAI